MNQRGRPLHAAVGHAIDLYRLARYEVFHPHSYSKFRMIKGMQRRTRATMLIETGTFRGVTTRRCVPLFERIYTIEIQADLARAARAYLASFPHVTVIGGDATQEVPRLLADGRVRDALIFLDGHFSGGGTGRGASVEPAIDILELLGRHLGSIRGVIVDDFREFGVQEGWPKKWELIRTAEELFVPAGFRLGIHLDQLLLERGR